MIPSPLGKQFETIINRKNRLVSETKEEKIERIKQERGLTHGKGKRKKNKSKKRNKRN